MKNALSKSAFREIKSTLSRFLSIFGIVAIGVGFFSGVKAASPDMKNTADKYFADNRLMDLRIVSTMGFDEDDVASLNDVGGLEVYPSYFADLIIHTEGRSPAASRFLPLEDHAAGKLNGIVLTNGRMPENENECLVDSSKMKGGPKVGSVITVTDNDGNEPDDMLSVYEFTIVGAVNSTMYIDKTTRGSTNVGSGSIESIYYIYKNVFCSEYNTQVYIRVPELSAYNTYSDEYVDGADAFREKLEELGKTRCDTRYSDAERKLDDAQKELDDAEAEYNEKIADAQKEIDDGEQELKDAEADISDGEARIAENEQKLIDGEEEIAENEQKLADAEKEISDGEKKLADAEKTIAEKEKELSDGEKEIADNEKKLKDAEKQYNDGLAEYNAGLKKYNDGLAQYEAGLKEYNEKKAEYDSALAQYESGKAAFDAAKSELEAKRAELEAAKVQLAAALGLETLPDGMLEQLAGADEKAAELLAAVQALEAAEIQLSEKEAGLDAAKSQLDSAAALLAAGKAQLDSGKAQLDAGKPVLDEAKAKLEKAEKEISDGKAALEDAKKQAADGRKQLAEGKAEIAENKAKLEDAKAELADGKAELEEARAELEDGKVKLEDGKKELEDGKKKYEDGKKELEDGKAEFEEKKADGEKEIADAKEKLADAREKLEDIKDPKWYVFTRDDNPGYAEFGENAKRINNIAAVFPVFFIVVAMLVCLTTMTRMVEEQRVQIGTLKALGYGNGSIIFKYMFYALSATVLGSVIGCSVGMYLFPFVIIEAYGIMYDIGESVIGIDLVTAATATVLFTAAISLTVFLTTRSALSEQSAQLMRPKAPKNGKRILLERITPLWKHFNFSGKVTARNLFRYKRKMLMTVIGISGCTALLVTGFALYDSINDVIDKQFNDIQDYDGIAAYDNEKTGDIPGEAERIVAENGESIRVYQKLSSVSWNGKSVDAYIAVPSDPDKFIEFFDLRSRTTGEKFALTDDTVYIDEKTTLLLGGIPAGTVVEVEQSSGETASVTMTAAFENYPNHYIYMTPAAYERLFGSKPLYNVLYFRSSEDRDSLGKRLLDADGVINVSFNSDSISTFSTMLDSLSMVIWVIIASAGLLAFVVVYNLTNINITERIREIATLKVLGFYDMEVDSYIFRENILLAAMGTGVGLVLGIFLATFIITTVEVDLVMFGRSIYAPSFIYSALITMVFSVLVTFAMHGRLKGVNMTESLKSVE